MPLRDHFRPPFTARRSWEGCHGAWPALIVMGLNRHLPRRYAAEPQVHLGSSIKVDVATFDEVVYLASPERNAATHHS